MYERLAASQDPSVTMRGERVRLVDFHSAVSSYVSEMHADANWEVYRKRFFYLGKPLGAILGGLLGVFLAWRLVRWARRTLPGLVTRLFTRTGRAVDDWHIRRVAVEETVRHTTREGLARANEQERAALRKQINAALETGDTDTARTLFALMERLDGEAAGKHDAS